MLLYQTVYQLKVLPSSLLFHEILTNLNSQLFYVHLVEPAINQTQYFKSIIDAYDNTALAIASDRPVAKQNRSNLWVRLTNQ